MTNHIHMIMSARNNDTSEILRDLKKYTSKKIISAIENNQYESRREWMLRIFREHGEKNSRNTNYQFWRHDNQPKKLYSPAFTVQKVNYIHNNPVEAGNKKDIAEYYRISLEGNSPGVSVFIKGLITNHTPPFALTGTNKQ